MENIDIVKVVCVRQTDVNLEQVTVRCAADAAAIVQRYLKGADREHFVCLMLNTKHVINAIHTVSIGSLDATIVHPREVFKAAILANASGIICAHCHPSGNPTPSPEDINITQRLVSAGELLGIEVLDHIIVGDPDFVSLKGLGYM